MGDRIVDVSEGVASMADLAGGAGAAYDDNDDDDNLSFSPYFRLY